MTRLGILPRREAEAPVSAEIKAPRIRWVSITIVVLVAVVGLAAAVYVLFGRTSSTSAPTLTYSAPTEAAVTPTGGACNFPVSQSIDVSQVAPVDTVWELTPGSTMAAPRSATAGPLKVNGGITSCYARTPSGALLAAANLVAEMTNTNLDLNQLVADKAVHSTGYDDLNQGMQAWLAQDRSHTPTRQIAGYRLTTFDANTATLEIVQRNTSEPGIGLMASIYYVLRWDTDAGDWKIVPMIDGGYQPSLSLSGLDMPYIPWAGA